MSESIGGVHYDLDLQDKKFEGKVTKARGLMGGLRGSFKDAEQGSNALLAGVTGLAVGIVAFGVKSVAAYQDSQTAQAQLEHAVIGVSKATKEQLKQTGYLAERLSAKGVLDDDAIKTGLAQLSTFGLTNKAVQNLGGSLADLTVNQFGVNASGEQVAQSANMIAKALNGQFGVLEKSGIRFTDAQRKMIQFGKESDKVKAITKGFAQNLKFTNEVAMQTSQGLDAHLGVQFGNIQEQIGEAIDNGLTPFKEQLVELMDNILGDGTVWDYFNNLLDDNKAALYMVAGAITIALLPALTALAASLWATMAPLLPFIAVGALLGLALKLLVDKFGGWDNLMKAVKTTLKQLWDIISPTLIPALNNLKEAFVGKNGLIPALKKLWDILSPILIPVLKFIAQVIGVVLYAAFLAIVYVIGLVIKSVTLSIDRFNSMWKGIKDGTAKVVGWFAGLPNSITQAIKNIYNAIMQPFWKAWDDLNYLMTKIKKKINDALNPFVRHSPSLVDWIHKGANEMTNTYADMFTELASISAQNRMGMAGAVKTVSGAVEGRQGSLSAGQVTNVTIPLTGVLASSAGELREIGFRIKEVVDQALRANGPQVKIIR